MKKDVPEDYEIKVSLERAEKFTGFYYVEIKDLGKQFITVVSAVLALTVTFAEKVVGFDKASPYQAILLISAWLLFIVSIIAKGAGIYKNFESANIANRAIRTKQIVEMKSLISIPYLLMRIAGTSFVIGLVLLAASAVVRICR